MSCSRKDQNKDDEIILNRQQTTLKHKVIVEQRPTDETPDDEFVTQLKKLLWGNM